MAREADTLFWSQDVLPEAFSCGLHERGAFWRQTGAVFLEQGATGWEGVFAWMHARTRTLAHFTAQTWDLSAAVGEVPFSQQMEVSRCD
jgi:hypothetical protein